MGFHRELYDSWIPVTKINRTSDIHRFAPLPDAAALIAWQVWRYRSYARSLARPSRTARLIPRSPPLRRDTQLALSDAGVMVTG
jgi:hypothetical protein